MEDRDLGPVVNFFESKTFKVLASLLVALGVVYALATGGIPDSTRGVEYKQNFDAYRQKTRPTVRRDYPDTNAQKRFRASQGR